MEALETSGKAKSAIRLINSMFFIVLLCYPIPIIHVIKAILLQKNKSDDIRAISARNRRGGTLCPRLEKVTPEASPLFGLLQSGLCRKRL